MERSVAIKKLGKILGKSLDYQVDLKAPDQDDRDEARAKLASATSKFNALSKQIEARRTAVLQADTEYQRLTAACVDARTYCAQLRTITCRYRFTVGTTNGLFFNVKAQGDSWEEIIAKLTKKQA